MKIKWYGHAAFKISSKDHSIFLDPFKAGSVPGVKDISAEANEVYCSHEHGDHAGKEMVTLIKNNNDSPFEINFIDCYHDHHKGEHRGTNKITVISDGEVTIAHLGDLGHLLNKDIVDQLKGVDALMIPVGGYFTINALEASVIVDMIKPKIVIPMHFSSENFGYDVIGRVDDFLDNREDLVICYNTSEIEVTPDSESHIALLALE